MRALPRWKRKLALGCLFAAGAVITLSLSGPNNALLAQQDTGTQPVATPTPFQYGSSLPVCSDKVVNAVLTPSVEPTPFASMDGPVLNCLWPSTPYPMNTDLGAIGAPGDPGPVSPLPQPATTPAPVVDWSDLPVCPDYMLTPPVEPTPIGYGDISTAPTCKLLPVAGGWNPLYQEWLEQGRDLRELGYYGDPVPDSAQMFPAPTPAAQAALEGAPGTASKPALLRQPQLYLPLLQNGADASTTAVEPAASALPTATILYADRLNHPYIPIDQLPECEDMTVNVPDYSVPDYWAPQCRARIVASVDIKALYDQGVDLEALGFPGDPPGPAPVILLTPVAQGASEVVSQTTNALAPQGQPQLYLPMLQR